MVPDVFLTMLRRRVIQIQSLDVIVFDECHNSVGWDNYTQIMWEFYFFGLKFDSKNNLEIRERPEILGLTAS